MILEENLSYYDLLELAPDASPQDIRDAYLRAKSAYKKDSVALYSLMSEMETDSLLRQIEEAYTILSNPEKRKVYDQKHGSLDLFSTLPAKEMAKDDGFFSTVDPGAQIVSIDRVPPMDTGDANMLVSPPTDFGNTPMRPEIPASEPMRPQTSAIAQNDAQIQQEIQLEVEWRGPFIRRIRENRGVAIEELSDFTKISKTYLLAIEEEHYDRLPALVFLRGFLIQVCKYLKIPQDKMVVPYLARVTESKNRKK